MMADRRRGRAVGVTLGTTLACLVALAVILFAAASAGVSHLKMVSVSTNADHAQNLAEAALSRALAELVKTDFKFGKDPDKQRFEVTVADLPGSSGVVSFNKNEAGFSDRYSTYNIDGDAAKEGAGKRQVPVRTVHLIARGKVGESESWVECLYYKPPFPDGLVSTGAVSAKSLYLAGVRHGGAYSGGDPSSIPPEDSVPANLFSNAADPDGRRAVELEQNCRIQGSVGAYGSVRIDASSVVESEVLPQSQPRAIPEIDIVERMAALRPNAVAISSSGGDLTLDANWFAQANSSLAVTGDLDLNGSVLLVDGDLTVSRAIKGTGIILVDGNVEIRDGLSNVVSADQVAIASTGNFHLRAESPEGNYFQGLVYCEGDLTAKDITVVGATVVNGKNGAKGSVTLDNVRFVQSPGGTTLELISPVGEPAGAQSWAVSVNLKAAPDGKEGDYLADARAYFTDKNNVCPKGKNCQHLSDCPNRDHPLTWEKLPYPKSHDRFSSWNSVTGKIKAQIGDGSTNISSGTAYPDGIPVRLSPEGEIEIFEGILDAKTHFLAKGYNLSELNSKPKVDAFEEHIQAEFTSGNLKLTTFGHAVSDFWTRQQLFHDKDPYDRVLAAKARIAVTQVAPAIPNQTQQSVTFNLNNLLGEELFGSSRVLLWRPLR